MGKVRMRQEKICILTSSFPRREWDPVSPFLYELCKNLVKIGHEVHVITPHYPGASEFEKMKRVNVHRFIYFKPKNLQILAYGDRIPSNVAKSQLAKLLVPFYIASLLKKALTVIKRFRIDVVFAFWAIPQGIVGVLAKKMMRRPLLTRIFPVELALSESEYKFCLPLLRVVIAQSDVAIPNSAYTHQRLVEFGCGAKKTEVIPPGVDFKKFGWNEAFQNPFQKYGIEEGDRIILSVGRLVERKGFEYLIGAMASLQNDFPSVKLLIVGHGPREEYLKSLAKKMKQWDRVVFAGEVTEKELLACYSRADVFVHPAIVDSKGDTEGLGVVLLEAMAAGKPVVATKVGGIPEAIVNGKTGLLVEPRDSVALQKAIRTILLKPTLGNTLGDNGKELVREKFDWPIIAQKFHELIKNLRARKRENSL